MREICRKFLLWLPLREIEDEVLRFRDGLSTLADCLVLSVLLASILKPPDGTIILLAVATPSRFFRPRGSLADGVDAPVAALFIIGLSSMFSSPFGKIAESRRPLPFLLLFSTLFIYSID